MISAREKLFRSPERHVGVVVLGSAFFLSACDGDSHSCGSEVAGATQQAIFGGSDPGRFLDLSAAEENAVVLVRFGHDAGGRSHTTAPCSGLVVSRREIMSARHCLGATEPTFVEVRVGDGPDQSTVLRSSSWKVHPTRDVLVVQVDPELLDSVEPIGIWSGAAADLIGARVAIAGFGVTDDGQVGVRRFTSEEVVGVEGDLFYVDGFGRSGACAGDSGGPALWWDKDRPVVVGVLSGGSRSCVDTDTFVSVANLHELVSESGSAGARACSSSVTGRCFSSETRSQSTWCTEGAQQGEWCTSDDVCGWNQEVGGFRCVPATSAHRCGTTDARGFCSSEGEAIQCSAGELTRIKCHPCSECVVNPSTGRAGCYAPGALDNRGRGVAQ